MAGGLVSYNHPYGTKPKPRLSPSQQDTLLASIASQLLASRVYSCDLLEAAYNLRAGVDLAHHVALWDVMSRNGVFMTGIGVSDDHSGTNWYGETNNWITSAWAASTAQPDLMAALSRGRCWSGTLSGFRGSLDLLVDGSVPMGSVSISSVNTRQLVASATALPAGGYLQVLQGAVDYAGNRDLASNAQVIASYPASKVRGGSVQMQVRNDVGSFVRTQVLGASGAVAGLSNPVWLLRNPPPRGIPGPRGA